MEDNLPREKKYSWWEKRTKTEKCLIVLSVFCVVIIIYLASNLLMSFPKSRESLKRDVCMTEKCIRASAEILKTMDRTVDPCEDFYKFACGKFIKEAIIPDDDVATSSFSNTGDKVHLQLLSLYEEPIRNEDSRSLKLIKTIYNTCMNTSKIEEEGLGFVKKEFKDFGGWPVIEPHWNEQNFDWKTLLYRLKKNGWRRTFFFSMYVDSDMKNSSHHIFTIGQPCMSYEMLKKGLNDTSVKAYYDLTVELAIIFGADRSNAVSDMRDVIDFEIELAKLIVPYEQRKNVSSRYNPLTIRELQRNFSSFPWLKLINNYLSPVDVLTSDDVVNLVVPEFFVKLNTFLPNVKKRTLANYMFSKLVLASTSFLPEILQRKQSDYARKVYGRNEMTPRWKRCVSIASRLNVAVSSLYVKKFFDKNTKQKVNEMTSDIKNSFLDTLRRVSWMDRKTKKQATTKAEHMKSFIGYPDEVLDEKLVEDYYRGLELNGEDHFLNLHFNISTFYHIKHVLDLRQPVRKPDWRSQAYSFYVNAYYVQTDNTIELPAAVLQDRFFDPDHPKYMNYGTIGFIIGHEITHGFDDQGRQYDKDGNVVDWWDPETNITFTRKSQCLVDQYSNYTVPEIEMSLNGLKTLGENIADNGGVKIAYKGYLKWLERHKAEPSLPGLPYTGRQLFWISLGSSWCTKYKKEALKQFVTSGIHSPSYFRVVVPLMNSDYFGRDFNCPLGSPMNPRYRCRVW